MKLYLTIVTHLLVCMALIAPAVVAEEITVPLWNSDSTWTAYREELIQAGFDAATITARNRDGGVTNPETDEHFESVTVCEPSGAVTTVFSGTTVTVPSGCTIRIGFRRVPFPPDSKADGYQVPDVDTYLMSRGLIPSTLYLHPTLTPLAPSIPRENYRGLGFKRPSANPGNLKVQTPVGIIVMPAQKNPSIREVLKDIKKASALLLKAIERLTAHLDRTPPLGANPSNGGDGRFATTDDLAKIKSELKHLSDGLRQVQRDVNALKEARAASASTPRHPEPEQREQ